MVVPSHAHYHIVDFGGTVSVAGLYVNHNDLIHADRHGAVIIPAEHAPALPEMAEKLVRREKVLIEASKQPGFDFEALRTAIGNARNVH
jgi:regulator of RNase E activity RraA